MQSKLCQTKSEKSSDVQHYGEAVKPEEISCQVTKDWSNLQRLLLSFQLSTLQLVAGQLKLPIGWGSSWTPQFLFLNFVVSLFCLYLCPYTFLEIIQVWLNIYNNTLLMHILQIKRVFHKLPKLSFNIFLLPRCNKSHFKKVQFHFLVLHLKPGIQLFLLVIQEEIINTSYEILLGHQHSHLWNMDSVPNPVIIN